LPSASKLDCTVLTADFLKPLSSRLLLPNVQVIDVGMGTAKAAHDFLAKLSISRPVDRITLRIANEISKEELQICLYIIKFKLKVLEIRSTKMTGSSLYRFSEEASFFSPPIAKNFRISHYTCKSESIFCLYFVSKVPGKTWIQEVRVIVEKPI
jgi:excinuclease UvrABC nuclease subunit